MTPKAKRKLGALGLLPDQKSLQYQIKNENNVVNHGLKMPKNMFDIHDAEQMKKEMKYPSAWNITQTDKEFRLKFDPKRIQE